MSEFVIFKGGAVVETSVTITARRLLRNLFV